MVLRNHFQSSFLGEKMFFYRDFNLILFFLLPVFLLILFFSKRFKRVKLYPYVDFFEENEKTSFKKSSTLTLKILKVIFFILSFSFLTLFLSKPYIGSKNVEYLFIYIDNTPLLNLKSEKLDSIITEYKKEYSFEKIVLFDNKKRIAYPFRKEETFNGELLKKDEVIRNFVGLINRINSPSMKKVLISDRNYYNFRDDFDLIKIENDFEILIVDILPELKIFSKDEKVALLSIDGIEEKLFLKKGMNYFSPNVDSLKFIKVSIDSLRFPKTVYLKNKKIKDLINEKILKIALKTLGYEISDVEIAVSSNDGIEKGIIFLKDYKLVGEKEKRKIIFRDENLKEIIKNGFDNLNYRKLSDIPGEPLILDDEGNKLVSYSKGKYYISLPVDTNFSNFVLTSGFLPLLDYILDDLSKNTLEYDKDIFEYREEILTKGKSFVSEEKPFKLKDVSKIFFILFLIFTFLFLLI